MERKLRRVELIHTGILAGGWLAAELAGWLLELATGGSGGLGGLGTQALVETVATVLRAMVILALPFLSAARSGAALMATRGEEPKLLPGLGRWREVLVTAFPVGLRCLLTGFIASYLAERLFFLTPMAGPVYVAIMEGGDVEAALAENIAPLTLIFIPVFCALSLPTAYRWRGLSFLIADRGLGGFQATAMTTGLTRWRKGTMFLEDLTCFWYYVPMALGLCLMGAAWLLGMLEISLPVPGWVLTVCGTALVLALDLLAGPRIRLAQARRYEENAAGPAQPKEKPAPRQEDLPWSGWDQN